MTRKEAILYLKWISEVYGKLIEHGSKDSVKEEWNDHWGKAIESLNMAIRILTQEPYDGLYIKVFAKSEPQEKAEKLYQICGNKKELIEVWKHLAEYCEINPDTDAVSRQTVKEQMIKYGFHAPDMTVTEFVEDLPPVTPKPKTGHWVSIDDEPHEDYECDRCGYMVSTWCEYIKPSDEYKFCPNCGADMREGES